jgi:hypothetical protein
MASAAELRALGQYVSEPKPGRGRQLMELLGQTWPVRGVQAMLQHPGNVYAGLADAGDVAGALDVAGGAMTGGIAGAPRGALGSGPFRTVDDTATRMARADEQNYHPRMFYHASDKTLTEFDPRFAGTGSNAGNMAEKATFFVDKPQVADSYHGGRYMTREGPEATADMGGGVGRYYNTGSQTYAARIRGLEDFDVWDMGGGAYDALDMEKMLKEARKGKAPGVVFQNFRDPGMVASGPLGAAKPPANVVAVFDTSRVRSPNAQFDPKKKKSRDILASLAAAGLISGAIPQGEQQ